MPTTNTHVAVHLALASGGTSKHNGRSQIENLFTISFAADKLVRLGRRHTKLWCDYSSALLTLTQAEVEAQSDKLVKRITEVAKPFNVKVKESCDPRGSTITLITSRRITLRGKQPVDSDLITSL